MKPQFRSLLLVTTFLVGLLTANFPAALAAVYSNGDSYSFPYGQIADPPPKGFKLWSSKSTWSDGVVPGVGSAILANATIPPGTAVMLDVPTVTLHTLLIQGFLKFLDSASLPTIHVTAHFVIVNGQLTIGTAAAPFAHQVIIELSPNSENSRHVYDLTSPAPADEANPRSLGHKSFAVVGGQVILNGMPGGSTTPSWCRLLATAAAGATTITVDNPLASKWPVGSVIAIASTDYDYKQAEQRTITKVVAGSGFAVLTLDSPLAYMHYGDPKTLPDGVGGFVEQRAEVGLLSRNIKIMGTDELAPYDYQGGHFMVYMTSVPQHIEGVEFFQLGQQGTLGRYSIHFHINYNSPNTVCRKNAIHRSYQRCVVIHASHNMTIDSNVAFNTSGHCFITEEGGEFDNKFINNLGFLTNAVVNPIFLEGQPGVSIETDVTPATFWLSNAHNSWINNTAAGSQESGFWLEQRDAVRGNSLLIPSLMNYIPILSTMEIMYGNVAHSNNGHGFRTYPHGFRPRRNDTWAGAGVRGTIEALTIYKNAFQGLFLHATDSLTVTDSTFADNGYNIFLNMDSDVLVKNSRMVAFTKNYGTPSQCDQTGPWVPCRPVSGCTLPLPAGAQGRSIGSVSNIAPIFGVAIDQMNHSDPGVLPNSIQSTSFSGFTPSCNILTSAILLFGNQQDSWNPSLNVSGLKFVNSQPIYASKVKDYTSPFTTQDDGGEQAQFYTLHDLDGSIIGGKGGYVVVNNPTILPPSLSAAGCTYQAAWNAYGCTKVCYRAAQVSYFEAGFGAASLAAETGGLESGTGTLVLGDYSYLQVVRIADGKTMSLVGNLNRVEFNGGSVPTDHRTFSFTLLAGYSYQVSVIAGRANTAFVPAKVQLNYQDGSGCGAGLDFQFVLPSYSASLPSWTASDTANVVPALCSGAASANVDNVAQLSTACLNKVAVPHVTLGINFLGAVYLIPSSAAASCPTTVQCGGLWKGSSWLYNPSGASLGAALWDPLATPTGFTAGAAPLGYTSWGYAFSTNLPQPSAKRVSYGFRTTFTLTNTACVTTLTINLIVNDGVILYLNGRLLTSVNMPTTGTVTSLTTASSQGTFNAYQTLTFPLPGPNNVYNLVEGTNYIAADVHMFATYEWQLSFDLGVSLTYSSSTCTGPMKAPEICDGVDNNDDGKVDETAAGKPLTGPCSSACGVGTATCIKGVYQDCSVGAPTAEICNGIDDDCDGLVDNGAAGLNCGTGKVCFAGTCMFVTNATSAVPVWGKNATGWSFYDAGGDLDASNSQWRLGSNTASWKTGQGPLGFDTYDSFKFVNTILNIFTGDGKSATAYFLKSFTLTAAELSSTYSLYFNMRRIEGAVAFVNGAEIWRSNMPTGTIAYNTLAPNNAQAADLPLYHGCTSCGKGISSHLQVGTNWIAVEMHVGYYYESRLAFDMDLVRNATTSCASLLGSPKSCVRQVQQTIIGPNSVYSYSTTAPSGSTWQTSSAASSGWASGPAPLGIGPSWLLSSGTTLSLGSPLVTSVFFKQTITVADAACYVELDVHVMLNDCGIVYINGAEALRTRIATSDVTSATFCTVNGDWSYDTFRLSGGWLKTGTNVIAVELHRASSTTSNVFFDLQLTGYREAITCTPAPV